MQKARNPQILSYQNAFSVLFHFLFSASPAPKALIWVLRRWSCSWAPPAWGRRALERCNRGASTAATLSAWASPAMRPCGWVLCRQRHRQPLSELPALLWRSRRHWNPPPRLQARSPSVLFFSTWSQGSSPVCSMFYQFCLLVDFAKLTRSE